jgi:hypothetical protein
MKTEKSDSQEIKIIREEVQTLKNRINLIEAVLDIHDWKQSEAFQEKPAEAEKDFELGFQLKPDDSIEFRVGEYGMAWLGNIVLLFGIAFLVQYLQNSGHQLISALIGFASVSMIYTGAKFTKSSLPYLSKLFVYTGHLLLFYTTLSLHFFQKEPLISSNILGLLVLITVSGVLFYLSYQRQSQLMATMALLMMWLSGIIASDPLFAAAITCAVALLSVLVYYRKAWLKLVFVFVLLGYLGHLNWLLNSPFVSGKLEFIASPGFDYLFLFASGLIFSLLALIPKKEEVSDEFIITSVVWNGLLFSIVLALTVATYFSKNYVPVFAAISVVCLIYSVILQKQSLLKITASMYALYGFMAMSVAFYGILLLPEAYMLLSAQSFLVVSMALWFRSRFIVVMNTILFVMLLIFYLFTSGNHNATNFSFMLVAFITARIINWKKERLNIKTEHIRNLYLVSGFVMTLVAFYHAVPSSYITASWICAAILFFIVGRLINNIKYRWLAIATLVSSGIKLIFVDLSQIDIVFRILMFLLLAVISISVSILYTKYLVKKKG